MTVSTTTRVTRHNGNDVATSFSTGWKFDDTAWVSIVLIAADGSTTSPAFTVTGAGAASGGTVTLTSVVPATGEELLVIRTIPDTQPTSLSNLGAFLPRTVERVLDRLTMQVQELQEQINRCVRLPMATANGVDMELPTPSAGAYPKWNGAANGWTYASTVVPDTATVSAFMETVLDDATAADARTTLGLGTFATYNIDLMTESVQFDSTDSVKFKNALTPSYPLVTGALTENPPFQINFRSHVNGADRLMGWNSTNGLFATTDAKFSWWYKSGLNARQSVLWEVDSAAGGSTFTFDGNIKAAVGSTSYDVGFKDVPITTQNANYTYALTDRGTAVIKSNTTAYAHTVPPNSSVAFPIGSVIAFANLGSAGAITITRGSGVTIYLEGTLTSGDRTVASGGVGRLWKVATDTWICGGVGVT